MKDSPPSRTADQFVVRFPDGMRDRIAEAAKANNRSMNAEIVARLVASFQTSGGDTVESTATVVADHVMAHVHVGFLRERVQRFRQELESTLASAKARQLMADSFYEEMSKLDEDTDSLAYRQMRLAEHVERRHVAELETRAQLLRADLERAERELAQALDGGGSSAATRPVILVGNIGRDAPSQEFVPGEDPGTKHRPAAKRRFSPPKK